MVAVEDLRCGGRSGLGFAWGDLSRREFKGQQNRGNRTESL